VSGGSSKGHPPGLPARMIEDRGRNPSGIRGAAGRGPTALVFVFEPPGEPEDAVLPPDAGDSQPKPGGGRPQPGWRVGRLGGVTGHRRWAKTLPLPDAGGRARCAASAGPGRYARPGGGESSSPGRIPSGSGKRSSAATAVENVRRGSAGGERRASSPATARGTGGGSGRTGASSCRRTSGPVAGGARAELPPGGPATGPANVGVLVGPPAGTGSAAGTARTTRVNVGATVGSPAAGAVVVSAAAAAAAMQSGQVQPTGCRTPNPSASCITPVALCSSPS